MTEASRAHDVVRWVLGLLDARAKARGAAGEKALAKELRAVWSDVLHRQGEVIPAHDRTWWLHFESLEHEKRRAAGPFTDGERAVLEDLVTWLQVLMVEWRITWKPPPTSRRPLLPGGPQVPPGY